MSQFNVTRYLLAALAAFRFTFVFDWAVHMHVLTGMYDQTPGLWRTPEDMQEHFHWGLISEALLSLAIVFLFTRNYEGKGVSEGIRFGFYAGLVLAAPQIGTAAWLPISFTLSLSWALVSVAYGVGAGVVAALVYRNSRSA